MRKFLTVIVLFAFVILPLTSCSIQKVNSDSTAAANAPVSTNSSTTANAPVSTTTETPASTTTDANASNTTESSGSTAQETTIAAEEPVDSGLTLESIKKAALDAGYAAEDMQEIQLDTVPSPIRGIYTNYKDEFLQSQSPVYEFKNSADAQEFARQVNEEGYSLSIVNGKFVTMTDSKYGIILNEKEKAFKESLLKSKVMAYEEPAMAPVSSNKDYAGAFTRIDPILKALDKLVNKSVLVYGKSLPAGEANNIGNVSFSLLSSPDLTYTATLCEDQTKIDGVVKFWEYFGCTDVKLKHDVPNDYTMTGKRAGVDTSFNIHCVYNPDKDAVRVIEKDGSDMVEFFEFVPLGADKYAFQTLYERAIVEYKDGKIISLTYSVNTRTKELAYNPKTVSIYPDGKGADTAWASKSGEDKYEQFITYDGTKLKISATDFTGKRIKVEIDS